MFKYIFNYRDSVVEFDALIVPLLQVVVEGSLVPGQPGIIVSSGVRQLVDPTITDSFDIFRKRSVGDGHNVIVVKISDVFGHLHPVPVASEFARK